MKANQSKLSDSLDHWTKSLEEAKEFLRKGEWENLEKFLRTGPICERARFGKMKVLEVTPFASECDGRIDVPGSKSISNRALILAALCETEVKLQGMLESEDASLMKEALISLGVSVQSGQDSSTLQSGVAEGAPVKNKGLRLEMQGRWRDFSPPCWPCRKTELIIWMARMP